MDKYIELVQIGVRLAEVTPQYGHNATPVTSPEAVYYLFSAMQRLAKEEVWSLHVNAKLQPLCCECISTGSLTTASLSLRDIAKSALLTNAYAIFLIHNHPSGDPAPSDQDINLTGLLIPALQILDIVLQDHIIIGRKACFSIKENKKYTFPT